MLAMFPDLDFTTAALGLPIDSPYAHRGALHSLFVALLIAAAASAAAPRLGITRPRAALLAGAAVASHGLLDLFSDAGTGVAMLWPFSNERFLAGWRPIPAISVNGGLLTGHNAVIVALELAVLLPVWLPGVALLLRRLRALPDREEARAMSRQGPIPPARR